MGQDPVYQFLGFLGWQQKMHSLCCFVLLSMEVYLFHNGCYYCCVLQCTRISSRVCLVGPLVVCHILHFTFYALTGLSCCMYVLVFIYLWLGGNVTTVVEWLALRHVVFPLSSVCWSFDLWCCVVSCENFLPFFNFRCGGATGGYNGCPSGLFCLFDCLVVWSIVFCIFHLSVVNYWEICFHLHSFCLWSFWAKGLLWAVRSVSIYYRSWYWRWL